mmetsp:Transcript_42165/g.71338  ORF Transcript_42165/g.71338 Transcript_42165/m.71338 type:complete len:236 (+) Transcript_42165:2721-3428(+)
MEPQRVEIAGVLYGAGGFGPRSHVPDAQGLVVGHRGKQGCPKPHHVLHCIRVHLLVLEQWGQWLVATAHSRIPAADAVVRTQQVPVLKGIPGQAVSFSHRSLHDHLVSGCCTCRGGLALQIEQVHSPRVRLRGDQIFILGHGPRLVNLLVMREPVLKPGDAYLLLVIGCLSGILLVRVLLILIFVLRLGHPHIGNQQVLLLLPASLRAEQQPLNRGLVVPSLHALQPLHRLCRPF